MKKLIFCIILLSCHFVKLNAQELIGKYANELEFITFKPNNTIEFSLNSRTCLSLDYKAYGKFEIKNNYLIIHSEEVLNQYSESGKVKQQSDSDTISVYVWYLEKDEPLEVATVALIQNKKIIASANTKNGIAKLFYKGNLEGLRLAVNCIGLQPFSNIIADNVRNNYKIYLSENPDLDQTQQFITDNGSGFEIKVEKNNLYLKRKKHICVKTNENDDCYEWIEFSKAK